MKVWYAAALLQLANVMLATSERTVSRDRSTPFKLKAVSESSGCGPFNHRERCSCVVCEWLDRRGCVVCMVCEWLDWRGCVVCEWLGWEHLAMLSIVEHAGDAPSGCESS